MRIIVILSLFVLSLLPGLYFGQEIDATDDTSVKEEIEKLKYADSAWRKNDYEYREMRKLGEASENEVLEFAEFVAELKHKVIEECEVVRQLGVDASKHGVDCVEIMEGYETEGGFKSSDMNALSVPIDESDLYEDELRKLENDFDDMILNAQDELQKKRKVDIASNRAAGQNNGNSQNSGSSGSNEGNSQKTGGRNGGTETNAGSPGGESMSGQGGEQGAGLGDHKSDESKTSEHYEKGDSRDDDIVARQLREAAEKETDPVLKEQLWKEYEKYKKSNSR
jgi:hypothetical protein